VAEVIPQNEQRPLCVDLDGTLIYTDTLMESMILAIRKKPYILFLLPLWIIRGRYYFKMKIGKIALPNPETLPFRKDVLEYLEQEKEKGRKIVLATATIKEIADSVAGYLGIFDMVLGSENSNNLRSKHKRNQLVELFGEKGFDYAGDSRADLAVWKAAENAILVEPSAGILNKVKEATKIEKIFNEKNNKFILLIKEIRIHQWLKNLLIFTPLLLAHKITNVNLFISAALAFLSFSFVASAVYVLNDLLDLESDRLHPRKRYRPFASGNLHLQSGFIIAPLFIIAGGLISTIFLPISFSIYLLIYIVLTSAYSLSLKKLPIFDVVILACLYTLRLVSGAAAVDVAMSPWLLGFSIFLFLSLAFIKRYQELLVMREQNKAESKGRGYMVNDMNLILNLGPVCGYMSVLVLALYVNGKEVVSLYRTPEILWLVVILHLFWISRMWLLAYRGKMDDDPMVFTEKDLMSYVIGLIVAVLAIGAALW
jgi:4-hydroxybenzoate polyprenyltransferase